MHYATSRKVAVSSPDEVTEFYYVPNLSKRTTALRFTNRTIALRFTQPLTEMSTGKSS
jgi:hypothetical protein